MGRTSLSPSLRFGGVERSRGGGRLIMGYISDL
jgi:hypothetical protein